MRQDWETSLIAREARCRPWLGAPWGSQRVLAVGLLVGLLMSGRCLAAADPASAQDDLKARSDAIATLMDLTGMLSDAEAASQQVAAQLRADNPSIPPEVWTRYAALVSDRATLLALYTPIYARHLSEADVAALIDYHRSPASQHLREKLPQIKAEIQTASVQYAADIAQDLGDEPGRPSDRDRSTQSQVAIDERTRLVHTLLRESGVLAQARIAMGDMMARLRQGPTGNQLPPTFWARAEQRLTDESTLLRLWTPAYLNHLSVKELQQSLDFTRSSLGQRYVQAQPAIRAESVEAATRLANESARRAIREVLGPLPQWRLQNPATVPQPAQ
jgi:hypothetical protein